MCASGRYSEHIPIHRFYIHMPLILRQPHRFTDPDALLPFAPYHLSGTCIETGHITIWGNQKNPAVCGHRIACRCREHSVIVPIRSEEHTSELQSRENLVCRLLLEKKK